jgi:predicted CxxxxCH...CXXCH cytochrome family protein
MRRWLTLAALLPLGCSNARPVVDGYRHSSYVHGDGILDPQSPEFHGTLIKNAGWNFDSCKMCHGDDFMGGAAKVSCYTCHSDGGPTGCTTCHGQPPKSGAHLTHVVEQKLDCTTCHVKPMIYTDAGHLDGKVEVTLDKGSWDGQRCSGTYCHGDTFTDTSAKNQRPLWNGSDQATCGSCHGLPPSNHARSNCAECHPSGKHLDGKIDLGDGSGSCSACHTIDPAKLSGAHLGHMSAPLGLRGPLDCKDCHQVPVQVTDPGHIDKAGGPQFTCNRECHGDAMPAWNDPPSAAYCGTCHAIPPQDATHPSSLRLTQCVTCHPTTIDATGSFVKGGTHMNGVVDAN